MENKDNKENKKTVKVNHYRTTKKYDQFLELAKNAAIFVAYTHADYKIEEDAKAGEGRIIIEAEQVIMSKAFASKEMEAMTNMFANADRIIMGPISNRIIQYVLVVADVFELK